MKQLRTALLCSLLISAVACRQTEDKIATPDKYCLDEHFKSSVTLAPATYKPVSEALALTGNVAASPDKVVDFVSLVTGVITNTWFSLGDSVRKGQVLAELQSTELDELQSSLSSVNARLAVARQHLKSVEAMFEDGIASQKDLAEARSELSILTAEKNKTEAGLKLYSAAPGKGVFQIKAPAAGVITAKNIAPGSQVTAGGDPLFTISDLREVWVMANVYGNNENTVQPGMQVEIRTLSYPGKVFDGRVTPVAQVYDNEAKVLKARVVLQNPGQLLKPGMPVDVSALRESGDTALSVPLNALIFDENQNFVVLYRDDCHLEIRRVEVKTQSATTAYLESGLEEGDQVVTQNQLLIYEQLKSYVE